MEGAIIWGAIIGVYAGLLHVLISRLNYNKTRQQRDEVVMADYECNRALVHAFVDDVEVASHRSIQAALDDSAAEIQQYYQELLGHGYRVTVGGITNNRTKRR